jgi:hypothetical protein
MIINLVEIPYSNLMSIYFDYFQNNFWKWSQLTPIRDQNILDSDVRAFETAKKQHKK